jgi:hypothetical protein
MKKIFGLLALVCVSELSHASGWTAAMTITQAFTEESDMIVIYVSNSTPYGTGCDPGSWIFTGSTDARRGRVWATVLSALATGQKVQFWYSDTCSAWSYNSLSSIRILAP